MALISDSKEHARGNAAKVERRKSVNLADKPVNRLGRTMPRSRENMES